MRQLAMTWAGMKVGIVALALAAAGLGAAPAVQAQPDAGPAAGLQSAAVSASCVAPLEKVSAKILATDPSLQVEVTNTDPACSAQVTLAIFHFLNRSELSVPDMVSARQLVENGQTDLLLSIINEVVNKSVQEFKTSETFTIEPNSKRTVTLRYPDPCIDVQVDVFYGAYPTGPILDAGIDGPRGDCDGCTPGYWKNHHDSWQGYTPNQTLESVFDVPDGLGMDNNTLDEALGFGGGPGVTGAAEILFRASVAALLNAAHSGVDYPLTEAQVIAQVNAALATNDRDTMLDLATKLDNLNNLGCPLN